MNKLRIDGVYYGQVSFLCPPPRSVLEVDEKCNVT